MASLRSDTSAPHPRVRLRAPRVLAVAGGIVGLLVARLLAIGADLDGAEGVAAAAPLVVFFADEATGWVGGDQAVDVTTDGGEHWRRELEAEGGDFPHF